MILMKILAVTGFFQWFAVRLLQVLPPAPEKPEGVHSLSEGECIVGMQC